MDSMISRRILYSSKDDEDEQNIRSVELRRELDAMLARGEELIAELKRACEGVTRGWSVWRYNSVTLNSIQERTRAVVSKYEQIDNAIEDYKDGERERKRIKRSRMGDDGPKSEDKGPTTRQATACEQVETPSYNRSLPAGYDPSRSPPQKPSSGSLPKTLDEDIPFFAPISPLSASNELGSMSFEGFYKEYLMPIFKDNFNTFKTKSLARTKKDQYDDITIVNGYDQAIQKFTELVFNGKIGKDEEAVRTFTTNPAGNWGGSIGATHLPRLVTFMAVVLNQPIEERREVYIENLLHPTNGPGGLTRILVKCQHVERIARKVDFLDVMKRPPNPDYLKYKNSNDIKYERVTVYPDLDFTFEYEVSKLPHKYRNRFIQVEEYIYRSKKTGEEKRDKTSYDISNGPTTDSIRERLMEQGKEIIQKEQFKKLVPSELQPPQQVSE